MKRQPFIPSRRQGFTLIEILVVLAIVGIISSITLGGFREMTQSSKRISCQTNLNQIYQAARLYAADEGGKFPYYANSCTSDPPSLSQTGTGLWKLYTFPSDSDPNMVSSSKPIERYIRSAKVFHCPSHIEHKTLLTTGTAVIDQDYLSYQTCDEGVPTYATTRTTTIDSAGLWKRQLLHSVPRLPTGDTVVTWCKFHRGDRDVDNVLFYDGSVQLMTKIYDGKTGWQREPKEPQ